MKYLKLMLLSLFLLPVTALPAQDSQVNAIDKYFQQYVEDDRFTVVYISKKLFQMLGKLDIEQFDEDDEVEAIMDIAQDLEGLRILVSEDDADELYAEAKAKIDTREYEVLMTVRSQDDENVEFLVRENGDLIEELLLLVGGDEFVLLSFVGNLDLNKISRLAREIED